MCPSFPHCKSDERPGGGLGNGLGTRHIVACIVNSLFGSRYKRRIQEKRGTTGGGERVGRDCHGTCLGCGVHVCYKQTNSKLVSMFSLVGGCGVLIPVWLPVILATSTI